VAFWHKTISKLSQRSISFSASLVLFYCVSLSFLWYVNGDKSGIVVSLCALNKDALKFKLFMLERSYLPIVTGGSCGK